MPPLPNDPHLKPGALVAGKYRLRRPIGEGAMGVVWAALNEATAREVALKLVVQQDRDLRARLLQEARACGRLEHRNIVQVYDVDQTERGEPFLVMPLLSGETLAGLLKRRRRLDIAEAARIGRDIARGLAAAHAMRIVHRDLKPSNIFLHTEPDEENYTIKLLDFGVSKVASTGQGVKTATGIILGSPAYMSPEQVRSLPDIDGRADIWCLGVVLYEMLAGVRPFQGSLEAILGHILAGEIPAVSQAVRNLDPRLAELVSACLQRDRSQRPQAATEIAGWLDAFAAPGGRHAGSPTPQGGVPRAAGHPAMVIQQSPGPYGVAPPARSSGDSELEEHTTLPLRRGDQGAPQLPHSAGGPSAHSPGAPQLPHSAGGPSAHSPGAPQPSAVDHAPQLRPHRGRRVALAAVVCSGALLSSAAVAVFLHRSSAAPSAPSAPTRPAESASASVLVSDPPRSAAPAAPPAPAGARADDGAPPPQLPPPASAQSATGGAGSSEKKERVPPPAPPPVKRPEPPPPEPPAREFDRNAARAALARADNEASACKGPGGPTGSGKVRVLFGRDGATLSVVLEGPLGSTPLAGCIMSAFRRARVPVFTGESQSVVRSFTIR